jgi:hypothetical protein
MPDLVERIVTSWAVTMESCLWVVSGGLDLEGKNVLRCAENADRHVGRWIYDVLWVEECAGGVRSPIYTFFNGGVLSTVGHFRTRPPRRVD